MALPTPSSRAASSTCENNLQSRVAAHGLTNNYVRLANGFAYWQGQAIDNATNTYFDDMSQAKAHIEEAAGPNGKNIRFGNGETGWPTSE